MAIVNPTPYCSVADLSSFGAPTGAFAGVDAAVQQGAVDGANAEADSYLGNIFVLPLTSWGKELQKFTAQLAAYDIFVTRGFDPGSPEMADQIRDRAKDARALFKLVAEGKVTPSGVVDSSPTGATPSSGGPGGLFVVQPQVVQGSSGGNNPLSGGSVDQDGSFSVVVGRPRLRGW